MGRRKIEIKAIKDDRNRSVTFLKRKGGLFKKAHELSVLCSVDVAVFIFGNNKKLYEYSSADMNDLIGRYQYHGGPNEHKGPADFNGGNDDDDDEDGDVTPPRVHDSVEPQMMPPQFHGHQQQPFPQIRHHTPSASPPIANGAFQGHPGHPGHQLQRGHTPQPGTSRPGSRNDMRRLGPGMVPQSVGPQGAHPGITYMPTPPIYNPPAPNQSNLMPQPGAQYAPYQPSPQSYMDDRRPPPPGYSAQPPSQSIHATSRIDSSPQPPPQQLPHSIHISPPPQPERRQQDPQPPPPVEPKTEASDRPHLTADTAIKKLPQRKSHSIFTPIEENRSILSQHLASFAAEPPIKSDSAVVAAAANRAQSIDVGSVTRNGMTNSPPVPQRSNTQNSFERNRAPSVSSGPDSGFTPPSRSDSLKLVGGSRPRGPRLTVQIPDGGSEPGSATAESNSPRNTAETSQAPQRHNSHSSMVLPPPSPSATALLSAGATGPPNPFARPPPQQSVNADTPVSALPSRFLNNEFLPSPSSFYQDWGFRGSDSNTLPSPLNFATPVVTNGPSFLREDPNSVTTSGGAAPSTTATSLNVPGAKRKSPDYEAGGHDEAKRLRVE